MHQTSKSMFAALPELISGKSNKHRHKHDAHGGHTHGGHARGGHGVGASAHKGFDAAHSGPGGQYTGGVNGGLSRRER
jgi:hypothetical protein